MEKKTMCLAHRGFSGNYPENSKAAFMAAFSIPGCDGLETDVHFSKDGQLVVVHDPVLGRTSNGQGMVQDHTYEQLQQLDIGSWMSPEFTGERMMLLGELLDECKERGAYINIEIKNYEVFYQGIEAAVIEEVTRRNMQDSVVLSSFNHRSMEYCKTINPEVKTGLLYDRPLADVEGYMRQRQSDAIHPTFGLLLYQRELTGAYQAMGKKVNTWTVNKPEDMRQMLALGVDAIITNYPDLLAPMVSPP